MTIVSEPSHRMGGEIYYREDKERFMHDPELREAYECGRKQGWREAMREAEDYHERKYDRDGRILQYRRDDDEWDDDDMYDERRRRSRRTGRYI